MGQGAPQIPADLDLAKTALSVGHMLMCDAPRWLEHPAIRGN
jgi:hypothetical protein